MYKTLQEAAKDKILRTNFEVFPYEWEKFIKMVKPLWGKNWGMIKDGDDWVLFNSRTNQILARYDSYDYILYTDITKGDFHWDIKGNKVQRLKQYFN